MALSDQQIENVYYNVYDSFMLAMRAAGIDAATVTQVGHAVEDAVTNNFDILTKYDRG